MAITSNVLLVIGIVFLIMLKLMLAIAFFAVSLAISLVIFNDNLNNSYFSNIWNSIPHF